jgi:hypothetical protein
VTEAAAPAAPKRAALSKELSEFLVELSIGVHRFAMYPPAHPSLSPVVENIVGRLAELFEDRRSLSIGVAQRQLVIEGIATDRRHALLSDLARRLHDHQLGALTFEKGVTAFQVSGVLGALSSETERGGMPLGVLSAADLPSWEHATLHPVGYDRLELMDDAREGVGGPDRADALWLGLAQAALSSDERLEVAPDAVSLAQSIRSHTAERAYDQVIVGYLLQLTDELKGRSAQESEKVRRRVSRLINELDDRTLSRLVDFGGNPAQRRRFLLDANQSLAVDSVVKLLEAAAGEERGISHSMTRLLGKLAMHAEQGSPTVRSQADTALRENVEALIEGWELKDPNPHAYTNILDAMARAAPIFHSPDGQEDSLTGAQRLVEMALEVDAYGPVVAKALSDILAAGGAGTILDHLKEVSPSNQVAERIRAYLTTPARFRELLAGGRMDDAALRALIEEMGSAAVDPLLDVLGDSDSRTVRRRVFDALVDMGPFVGQRAVERLADGRWFVLRNMLSLLQRLEHLPEGFDPQSFVDHKDARVRREALPLALRRPGGRERALALALADTDERIVRMALLDVRHGVPDAVLPTLVNRVVHARDRSAELRSLAVEALASSRSPLALTTLVGLCTAGRSLFGKAKLASPTLEMLTALRALATGWAHSDEAKDILAQAQRAKEPKIRAALHLTSAAMPGAGGTS